MVSRLAARWRDLRVRDHLSLRAQLVTITALLAGLVAVGLVLVVQLALAGAAQTGTERVLDDRADALVMGISAASSKDTLTVPRARLGPGVAVYDGDGNQVAGSAPPAMIEEFRDLSRAPARKVVASGDAYAIMAKPFTTAAGVHGVVVITEPLAPYERNEQAAMVVSIIAGVLLVLMASGSAAWISRRVLSPVEQMARTAGEWSERDLERRFALGPPSNEIRALGNTLDGLLDKVAGVIRAEQRLTSELAHELRTPLTTIHGAVDLLAMRTDVDEQAREDLALIKNASTAMSNTITVLLDVARRESSAVRLDHTSLADLGSALQDLPLVPGELRIDLGETLTIDVPRALAIRALAPVVNNALEVADRAHVTARRRGRSIDILVADAGPGIPDAWVDSLFSPGWSGSGGSGLGLPLARRVARSGGGDVTLAERHNEYGGATFAVTFPGGDS